MSRAVKAVFLHEPFADTLHVPGLFRWPFSLAWTAIFLVHYNIDSARYRSSVFGSPFSLLRAFLHLVAERALTIFHMQTWFLRTPTSHHLNGRPDSSSGMRSVRVLLLALTPPPRSGLFLGVPVHFVAFRCLGELQPCQGLPAIF